MASIRSDFAPTKPGDPTIVRPAALLAPDDGPADSSPDLSHGRVGRSGEGTGPHGSDDSNDERVAEDSVLADLSAERPDPARPAGLAGPAAAAGSVAAGSVADREGGAVVTEEAREHDKRSPDGGVASGGGDGGSACGDPGGSAGEGEHKGGGDDGGASAREAEVRLKKDEEAAEAVGEGEVGDGGPAAEDEASDGPAVEGAVPSSTDPKEEADLSADLEPEVEGDGAYVTAANSSAGESEEDGAYVTAANSDAGDGDSAGETAVAAHSAVNMVSRALGLVARSHDLPGAVVDLTSCRAYRDGRAFHVKVSANTPRYVWSPPSPPPPPVGGGRGSDRAGGWGLRGPASGRAGSRVALLRVSHITWDRQVLFVLAVRVALWCGLTLLENACVRQG